MGPISLLSLRQSGIMFRKRRHEGQCATAQSVNFWYHLGQGCIWVLPINPGHSKDQRLNRFIDNYKKNFPGIQKFMDDTINLWPGITATVETFMGKSGWLRDINSAISRPWFLPHECQSLTRYRERLALSDNTGMQRSCWLWKRKDAKQDALQVHDELSIRCSWRPSKDWSTDHWLYAVAMSLPHKYR